MGLCWIIAAVLDTLGNKEERIVAFESVCVEEAITLFNVVSVWIDESTPPVIVVGGCVDDAISLVTTNVLRVFPFMIAGVL